MNKRSAQREVNKIDSIINNHLLASDIHESVTAALECRPRLDLGAKTAWEVFENSHKAAIYDIKIDEKAELFLRLIKHGPHNPDVPETLVSDNATTLSDPECGACVQFIYSHMVNRFKGELAELLALKPCIELVQTLQDENHLPPDIQIHWGDMVQERRRSRKGSDKPGPFTKGADGLLMQKVTRKSDLKDSLTIHGVVEVKSYRAGKKALDQINKHCSRLERGVKLGSIEYPPEAISSRESGPIRILIAPSSWKLDRELCQKDSVIVYQDPFGKPVETQFTEAETGLWKITLSWSQEALEQAAYEMTFGYMAEVGKHVYTEEDKPEGWENMTAEEKGLNAIKMALYYLPLRPLTENQEVLAVRLYNIYGFGYPLGIDYARKKQMLWSENGKLVGQPLHAQ